MCGIAVSQIKQIRVNIGRVTLQRFQVVRSDGLSDPGIETSAIRGEKGDEKCLLQEIIH